MYAIGTQVRYHGSLTAFHGEVFTVARHCCDGTRYTLAGEHVLRHVRPVSVTVWEDTPADDAADHTAIRSALTGAITNEHPVMITYVAEDGEWTTRTVEPYEVTLTSAGNLIVRAMDRRSGEPRSFRIDRIRNANVLLGGTFLLDRFRPDPARAALDRIRAEIRQVARAGFGGDAMHWTPGSPVL